MYFESIKKVINSRIKAEAKLDMGLIGEVKQVDNDVFSLKYMGEEMGNPLNLPFQVSSATLYVKVTDSDVYTGAVVEFADDYDYCEYCEYADGNSVEFDVYIPDGEKIKLLSTILNRLSKQ